MKKPILDPCCGSRMFYFNKDNPLVLFGDCRCENITMYNGRKLIVDPEIILDFTNLPFMDNTFNLVIFDPPHLLRAGSHCYMAQKYGVLNKEWREVLTQGFKECFRVLKPGHTLIFKWNEYQIPIKDILLLCGHTPICGTRCGKASKTHWLVFYKE